MTSLPTNVSTSSSLVQNENTSYDNQWDSGTFSYPLKQPFVAAIFVVICVTIVILCIFGNTLVLFVVSRSTPMYPRTTYLLLSNLAVADLLVGIFCVIPYMYRTMFFTWDLSRPLCKLWKFVESLSITVSILSLQAIALERFIAINYPLQARRLFTNRNIRFVEVLVWLIACIYGTPMLIIWDLVLVSDKVDQTYCVIVKKYIPIERIYSLINFLLWYLLPMICMTVLYWKIGLTLKQSELTDQRHTCPVDSREASGERDTDGSSSGGSARQDVCVANPSLTVGTRTQPPRSTMTVVTRVKIWWKKRKLQNPGAASSIVKQGCCRKSRHGSLKKATTSNKDARVSGENQETSFTIQAASRNRVPRTFSFQGIRTGNRRGVLGCLEPELSSHGASGSGENQGHVEGVPLGRRLSQGQQSSASENSQTSRARGAIPRCRLTTQYNSRRRAIRLLVVVVASFAILLLPVHIHKLLSLLQIQLNPLKSGAYFAYFIHLCTYMNSAINPILYTFVSQTFRCHLREAFCSCRSRASRCIRFRRASKPEVSSFPNTGNTFC